MTQEFQREEHPSSLRKKISVIVPCWNEAEVLPLFLEEIVRVMHEWPEPEWELIFIDDGSVDKTLSLLRRAARADRRVRYASFSRNFGKEAAMLCGLKMSTGDFVAFVDADLQHPPALLGQMYDILRSDPDVDVVGACRQDRSGEAPVRSFLSQRFYGAVNAMSHFDLPQGATDFRLMRRVVADAILALPEHGRFTKGLFALVGFHTRWIPYENVNRAAGESKWSFSGLLRYSLEGICSLSLFPLRLPALMGGGLLALALILWIAAGIHPGSDMTPVLCGMISLVGGVILLCMALLGHYLGKTYLETKARPLYFVRETDEENK